MKKSILSIGLVGIAFTLAAFSFMDRHDSLSPQDGKECIAAIVSNRDSVKAVHAKPDFEIYYDVDSRFLMTVTKEELAKAETFLDLFPRDKNLNIVSYSSVNIARFDESGTNELGITSESGGLNASQRELLRSYYYSTNFVATAYYKKKNESTGFVEESYSTPHFTIVPETEAYLMLGKESLVKYIKKNTDAYAHLLDKKTVQAGKVTFTVGINGNVSQALLTSTSGSAELDERVQDLILNMPMTWIPAADAKGLSVAQDFVFFFGIMGC
jgi:hypothetical protein